MTRPHPLTDIVTTDPEDLELVRHAQGGSREALELLIARHQSSIYNVVLGSLFQMLLS